MSSRGVFALLSDLDLYHEPAMKPSMRRVGIERKPDADKKSVEPDQSPNLSVASSVLVLGPDLRLQHEERRAVAEARYNIKLSISDELERAEARSAKAAPKACATENLTVGRLTFQTFKCFAKRTTYARRSLIWGRSLSGPKLQASRRTRPALEAKPSILMNETGAVVPMPTSPLITLRPQSSRPTMTITRE